MLALAGAEAHAANQLKEQHIVVLGFATPFSLSRHFSAMGANAARRSHHPAL